MFPQPGGTVNGYGGIRGDPRTIRGVAATPGTTTTTNPAGNANAGAFYSPVPNSTNYTQTPAPGRVNTSGSETSGKNEPGMKIPSAISSASSTSMLAEEEFEDLAEDVAGRITTILRERDGARIRDEALPTMEDLFETSDESLLLRKGVEFSVPQLLTSLLGSDETTREQAWVAAYPPSFGLFCPSRPWVRSSIIRAGCLTWDSLSVPFHFVPHTHRRDGERLYRIEITSTSVSNTSNISQNGIASGYLSPHRGGVGVNNTSSYPISPMSPMSSMSTMMPQHVSSSSPHLPVPIENVGPREVRAFVSHYFAGTNPHASRAPLGGFFRVVMHGLRNVDPFAIKLNRLPSWSRNLISFAPETMQRLALAGILSPFYLDKVISYPDQPDEAGKDGKIGTVSGYDGTSDPSGGTLNPALQALEMSVQELYFWFFFAFCSSEHAVKDPVVRSLESVLRKLPTYFFPSHALPATFAQEMINVMTELLLCVNIRSVRCSSGSLSFTRNATNTMGNNTIGNISDDPTSSLWTPHNHYAYTSTLSSLVSTTGGLESGNMTNKNGSVNSMGFGLGNGMGPSSSSASTSSSSSSASTSSGPPSMTSTASLTYLPFKSLSVLSVRSVYAVTSGLDSAPSVCAPSDFSLFSPITTGSIDESFYSHSLPPTHHHDHGRSLDLNRDPTRTTNPTNVNINTDFEKYKIQSLDAVFATIPGISETLNHYFVTRSQNHAQTHTYGHGHGHRNITSPTSTFSFSNMNRDSTAEDNASNFVPFPALPIATVVSSVYQSIDEVFTTFSNTPPPVAPGGSSTSSTTSCNDETFIDTTLGLQQSLRHAAITNPAGLLLSLSHAQCPIPMTTSHLISNTSQRGNLDLLTQATGLAQTGYWGLPPHLLVMQPSRLAYFRSSFQHWTASSPAALECIRAIGTSHLSMIAPWRTHKAHIEVEKERLAQLAQQQAQLLRQSQMMSRSGQGQGQGQDGISIANTTSPDYIAHRAAFFLSKMDPTIQDWLQPEVPTELPLSSSTSSSTSSLLSSTKHLYQQVFGKRGAKVDSFIASITNPAYSGVAKVLTMISPKSASAQSAQSVQSASSASSAPSSSTESSQSSHPSFLASMQSVLDKVTSTSTSNPPSTNNSNRTTHTARTASTSAIFNSPPSALSYAPKIAVNLPFYTSLTVDLIERVEASLRFSLLSAFNKISTGRPSYICSSTLTAALTNNLLLPTGTTSNETGSLRFSEELTYTYRPGHMIASTLTTDGFFDRLNKKANSLAYRLEGLFGTTYLSGTPHLPSAQDAVLSHLSDVLRLLLRTNGLSAVVSGLEHRMMFVQTRNLTQQKNTTSIHSSSSLSLSTPPLASPLVTFFSPDSIEAEVFTGHEREAEMRITELTAQSVHLGHCVGAIDKTNATYSPLFPILDASFYALMVLSPSIRDSAAISTLFPQSKLRAFLAHAEALGVDLASLTRTSQSTFSSTSSISSTIVPNSPSVPSTSSTSFSSLLFDLEKLSPEMLIAILSQSLGLTTTVVTKMITPYVSTANTILSLYCAVAFARHCRWVDILRKTHFVASPHAPFIVPTAVEMHVVYRTDALCRSYTELLLLLRMLHPFLECVSLHAVIEAETATSITNYSSIVSDDISLSKDSLAARLRGKLLRGRNPVSTRLWGLTSLDEEPRMFLSKRTGLLTRAPQSTSSARTNRRDGHLNTTRALEAINDVLVVDTEEFVEVCEWDTPRKDGEWIPLLMFLSWLSVEVLGPRLGYPPKYGPRLRKFANVYNLIRALLCVVIFILLCVIGKGVFEFVSYIRRSRS